MKRKRAVRWMVLTALGITPGAALAQDSTREAVIQNIAADHGSLIVKNDSSGSFTVVAVAQALKDSLADWRENDRVILRLHPNGANLELQTISAQVAPVADAPRIAVLFSAVVLCLGFTFLVSNRNTKNILFIGEDKRYSNSKCQISLWFGVVIVTYLSTIVLRRWYGGAGFNGSVSIPVHLGALSGLSALTFAGAKGITVAKNAADKAAGGLGKRPDDAGPSFPSDLLQDDKDHFDLGDFQMMVITLLAVGVYLVQVYDFLGGIALRQSVTLPDVDSTLLTFFGLGQGAYLTKKAVSGPDQ